MTEETLFHAVLAKPASERAALLEGACLGNPELLVAVQGLLAAHEASLNPLDQPLPVDATQQYTPNPAGQTQSYTSPDPTPGVVIVGRYTLEQKIGEGGMGEVWVAKQSEPVKRKVALKLIKAGMDSKSVVQRFEQERQALAMMDHPNIAKVLDGGITEHRQPFFVMELVNGLPLNKFCDEAKLSINERLELFVPICQAVQHAHQKGIVHRDLKPSNILVTMVDGNPVPKVIDFGVAKATSGRLTDESMSTQFGAVMGTLEYMSPEQAGFSNQDVDTRADIYSLGVILYELLTGLRPFDSKRLKQAALDEVIRIIREEEPSKPSTKLSTDESLPSLAAVRHIEPGKLTALLRGELDWVVMKCLEKQRDRRYETANGLARDIQRYLASEVVEARPPSAGYRLKMFVRRNKGQVMAAGLVFIALLAGIAGTAWQAVRAERARAAEASQREKAEKAYARTADVLDTMVSEVTGDSLSTQKTITPEQKKFLTEVLTYYREFAGEKANDEKAQNRIALATGKLGLIEFRLGRLNEAAAAFTKAKDSFASLSADYPSNPEYRRELSNDQYCLGFILIKLSRYSEAEEQLNLSMAILGKLAAEFPVNPQFSSDLAHCHNIMGVLLHDLGKFPAAVEQLRLALSIQEKLAVEFPASVMCREHIVMIRNNIGQMLTSHGHPTEAELEYRNALTISEKLVAEFPSVAAYRYEMACSFDGLAQVQGMMGKQVEVEAQCRKALSIRENLADEFPSAPKYRHELAMSYYNLASVLREKGELPEAEKQYRKALGIWEKLSLEFPTVPEYRKSLATILNSLGALNEDLSKASEAEELYRKAIAIQEKLAAESPNVPSYREHLAMSANNLGILQENIGKKQQAVELYQQAINIQKKLFEEFPNEQRHLHELVKYHTSLGVLLQSLNMQPEAEEQYRQAIAINEKLVKDYPTDTKHHINLAGSYCNLGNLTRDRNQLAESLEWYAKAITILAPIIENNPKNSTARKFLRNTYWGRATASDRMKRASDAVKDWESIVKLSEGDFVAWAHYQHGLALDRIGNAKDSIAALDRAHTLRAAAAKVAGADEREPHWLLLLYLIDRGKHEAEKGRRVEAVKWFTDAVSIGSQFVEKWPSADASNQLRWAYHHRADNLGLLGRQLDALKDWDRAIELSPVQEQPLIRARRAQAQVYLGKVDEGIQEATELRSLANTNADIVYQVACIYSIASGKVADKKQVYCDTAMELLQQAVKTGWTNATHMKQDSDLDPLRDREDFKKLLAELEKSKPPAIK